MERTEASSLTAGWRDAGYRPAPVPPAAVDGYADLRCACGSTVQFEAYRRGPSLRIAAHCPACLAAEEV